MVTSKKRIFFILLLLIGAAAAFPQDVKNALLIANGAYGRDIGALTQPVPEGRTLKSALESIGFNVTIVENANFEQMGSALQAFKEKNENEGGIALFHYGGHALQVNGVNYLIPANEKIENQNKVRYRCINVDEVMDSMLGDANIVVLDSCRNNPFQSTSRGSASSRGLAAVTKRPANSIIVYSADSGQTAKDGVFTPILTKHITEKDTSIENVLKKVRRDVLRKTNDEQHTGEYSQLVGQIYLAGKTEAGVSAKTLTGFLDISVYTPCSVLVDGMHIKDLNGFSQERFELSSGIHKIKVKYADGKSESLNTIIKAGTSETWSLTYLSYDQRRVCYELGNRYFYGSDNTRKDEAQAFEYYAIAADAGESVAQYAAGRCYENGNGVQKDEKAAFDRYKKAAENGNADAMNALGIFYQYGKGGESTDYREAKRLYEKAVAGGNAEAKRNLERINALLSGQERQTASARTNAEEKTDMTPAAYYDGIIRAEYPWYSFGMNAAYTFSHFAAGDIVAFNAHGFTVGLTEARFRVKAFEMKFRIDYRFAYKKFGAEELIYNDFTPLILQLGAAFKSIAFHTGMGLSCQWEISQDRNHLSAESATNFDLGISVPTDLEFKLGDRFMFYGEYRPRITFSDTSLPFIQHISSFGIQVNIANVYDY